MEFDALAIPNNLSNRIKWELQSRPTFSLAEPNDKILHVESSFAPKKQHFTFLMRFFFLAWSLQVLYYDIKHYPVHNLWWYMGYLTHWGFISSIVYQFSALFCSIQRLQLVQPEDINEIPSKLVCMTWMMYTIVAPLEISITLLFWTADYDPSYGVSYVSAMKHGIICIFILFDGVFLATIPVRLRHYPYFLSVCVMYLLWSLIVTFCEVGNGDWNGPAEDDDEAFYNVLKWETHTKTAVLISLIVMIVIAPVTFSLCWLASLMNVDSTSDGTRCCCCFVLDGGRRPLYYGEHDEEKNGFDYRGVQA